MIKLRNNSVALFGSRYLNLKFKGRQLYATETSLKPWTELPGLSTLPILGTLHHFLPMGSVGPVDKMYMMAEKLRKHGELVKIGRAFGRNPMIITFRPEHMEQIMRNENVEPNRDGFKSMDYFRMHVRKEKFDGVYGLFTSQGAQWKDIRSKVNPAMLLPHIVKLYQAAIGDVADQMINRIKLLKDDREYLKKNLDLELTKWSLESIGVVALGRSVGCLRDDLAEDAPARQLLNSARDIFIYTHKLEAGASPWRWISTPTYKKAMDNFDLQLRLSEMYITEVMEEIRSRKEPIAAEERSVLEKLLEIDPKVAVVMAVDMLAAGVDTVAHQMISILYLLATNPDKQDKLRQNIRSDADKRSYVKACIKESMRLLPSLSANLRGTTREHVLDGYLIPKGIDVLFPNEYMSKQEEHYPRAQEFIPERWTVAKTDSLYHGNAHPMVTQPFGFGIRSCIGRRIAELEMETFLDKFIDHFEVGWDGSPPKRVSRSVNLFLSPFNFVISDAK